MGETVSCDNLTHLLLAQFVAAFIITVVKRGACHSRFDDILCIGHCDRTEQPVDPHVKASEQSVGSLAGRTPFHTYFIDSVFLVLLVVKMHDAEQILADLPDICNIDFLHADQLLNHVCFQKQVDCLNGNIVLQVLSDFSQYFSRILTDHANTSHRYCMHGLR